MSITNVPYFKPTSIGGCSLWLDGADPAGTGVIPAAGNLATWVDKSSAANNATAGTSVYPQYITGYLNNLGVIGLTNAADYFTVANNLNSSSLTYVLLVKPTTANTGSKCGFLSTDTPGLYGRSIALNNMVLEIEYYNGFALTSITTNSSTWYIISVVFDGTSSITLSYNGIISTYAGSGTGTNSAGLVIGSYNNSASYTTYNANFYLAEAIVYSSALSQTQYQQVEAYLAQKWGITGSLPTGHPGYSILQYRSPTFSPTQLPGCAVWLDGGDSNTISFSSGSSVSTWIDKSGNGRNATVYAGTPTYTSALGMTFNGSSSLQITYTASPTIETMFIVIKFNSVAAQSDILSGTAAGQREYIMYSPYSPGTIYLGRHSTAPSGSITGGTVTTGTNYLLGYVFNGTANTISFYQSGNTITSGTPQFTYSAGGTISVIGSYNAGGYLQGQIYEMIIYSTALSTTDRQQVEAYLAKKWVLGSSLSSDHLGATSVAFKNSSLLAPVPFSSLPYAFAPTQIAGCSLWLDGADPAGTGIVPAAGASISTWTDKTINGNNATNQGGAGTVTFTDAGLVFNGSGYFYVPGLAGSIVNKAFVIFMVETLNSTNGVMLIGDDAQTNYNTDNVLHIMYRSTTNHTFAFYADDLEDYAVSLTGIRRLWTFYLPTAANRNTRRNGGIDVTHGNYNRLNYWTTPAIGRGFGGYNYVGTMSEVILYPSDIGLTDIKRVEAYLAQKWGLKTSLAVSHPGLTTDYYNSQSIVNRAAITVAPRLSKIPIILSGLKNRWAFNEGTGSVFYDSVSGQTGTLIGATSWVSAANTRLPSLTNAIYFANTSGNGNSQYGQIVSGGIGINTLTTANWSISLWFKALTFVAQGADVYFSINSPTTRYWNFYVGNGSGNLYNYSGSGAGGSTSISGTVATNVWSHVVYSCSSSSITVYVNGSSAGTGTWPSFSFPSNTYLTVGIENISAGSLNYGANMYMQDVRVYNRALSATEVTAIYNNLG